MAFLTKDDLISAILEEELEEIIREDDTIVESCMEAAVAEARMYLYDSFDVDAIFGATGQGRNALLLALCRDIAIYYVVARCQAGQQLDDRSARYDRAVDWLKRAAKTEFYADLPRRENTVQGHFQWGSREKRSNYF